MSYISYFDLLGTRGFCENSEVYYRNIKEFYETVQQQSCFLSSGKVGIFSDCAYAQSPSLYNLLLFLVEVRDRLLAQGLFFNAVVKEGDLDINVIEKTDTRPAFGVVFNNSKIADLFITQSQFTGIGIWIDPSLTNEIDRLENFKITKCFYLEKKVESGRDIIKPIPYNDIAFTLNGYTKEVEHTLDIFFHEFYSAYIKSKKFGMYYISSICNFLRSCNRNFKWDFEKKVFISQPLEFKTIENMLRTNDLSDFRGIEYLALIMLDIVYNAETLNEEEVKDYTKRIVGIECVKKRFIHNLNEVPKGIFSNNISMKINNRELFIKYCQDDLSNDFVETLFE